MTNNRVGRKIILRQKLFYFTATKNTFKKQNIHYNSNYAKNVCVNKEALEKV